MKPGENLEKLKFALQTLAQPAESQLKLYLNVESGIHEMALDYYFWFSIAIVGDGFELTSFQEKLLDLMFSSFKPLNEKELWTDIALYESQEWGNVRNFAKQTLKEFSWQLEMPPDNWHQHLSSDER